MRKISYPGLFFILLGAALILRELGFLNFSVWHGFATYWPFALVIIGLAIIFKLRSLAFVTFVVLVIFGSFYILQNTHLGEARTVDKRQMFEPAIKNLDVNIGYGAGDIRIADSTRQYIYKAEFKTSDVKDPVMDYGVTAGNARLDIERSGSFSFWRAQPDVWGIKLSPNVPIDLDLEYGAADADFDLSGLMVDALTIDTGASDTEIIFGSYPTDVSISAGASSFLLKFPDDVGVEIEVDAGVSSIDLEGFTKKGEKYYSNNHAKVDDVITINIDAGASSIEGEFY